MHCDKFFGDLPWWAVWSQSLWSWPCSPGRTQASLKMLPFLNPDVHKLCNHPPQLKHFKSQQSIRARKQLTRVTDCETARLWLCHLHFWGNFDSLSSSEAAANITLSSWLLTRTSEAAANMTARSRASAQVHIITELSNLTIHKIHKISSVQDVTSLTHLFPLTTVTGGWVGCLNWRRKKHLASAQVCALSTGTAQHTLSVVWRDQLLVV